MLKNNFDAEGETELTEEEAFHIIHKALYLINEQRQKEQNERLQVLDSEIGFAAAIIAKED